MQNILITGGAGFIGSHLADKLIEINNHVIVVDDLSRGKKENVHKKAAFSPISIKDKISLENVFKAEKPEFVFHFAAQIDVRASTENPAKDADVNIIGTLNLLDLCVKHGVKKIIFASTGGAIYGEAGHIPTPEHIELPSTEGPLSPYGIAKQCAENYIKFYQKVYGLPYSILRFANVYGPRQDPHGEAGVIAIFINSILKGKAPTIFGDGTQTRDFVFVNDVICAALKAWESQGNEIYNIGTGIKTDINKIYEIIKNKTNFAKDANYAPEKPGEQKHSCLDSQKAQTKLGWRPSTTLADGIEHTIKFFREKNL